MMGKMRKNFLTNLMPEREMDPVLNQKMAHTYNIINPIIFPGDIATLVLRYLHSRLSHDC